MTTLNREEIIDTQAKAMYELNFKGKEATKYDVSWEDLKIKHPDIAKILVNYSEAALDALLHTLQEPKQEMDYGGGGNNAGYLYKQLLSLKSE